jgi:glycosyltransferase involved in cell wall biosynthesis
MNILFINSLYHPYIGGGAEIILKNLVEGLYRKGHQVTVLTTGHESGRHEEQVNGIRVIRLGIKNIYWHYDETKVKCWRRVTRS